jgi:hypothetical protein
VLDRVFEHHRRGHPLNVTAAGQHDPAIVHAAVVYLGSWDMAVAAVGIEPESVRLTAPHIFSTREAVIAEIRFRRSQGQDLASSRAKTLAGAGARHFDSWERALAEAGVDPAAVRLQGPAHRYDAPEQAVRAILRRREAGLPLHAQALHVGAHANVTLYKHSRRHFGSWARALAAAGLDPSAIQHHPGRSAYWDREAVVAELTAVRASGEPLSAAAVARRRPSLYQHARRHFGSWDDVLRAMGWEPGEIHLLPSPDRKYPTPQAVVSAIVERRRGGRALRSSAVERGLDRDASLHNAGRRFFGGWRAALIAAGVDPSEVGQREIRHLGPKQIISEILERRARGEDLHASRVPSFLRRAGRRHHGSWPAALAAAGVTISPLRSARYPSIDAALAEIRRRARSKRPLNSSSLQAEDVLLYRRALEHFRTWAAALEAAGIDPATAQKRRSRPYPTEAAVVSEIQRRHRDRVPIHAASVAQGQYGDMSLYRHARHLFGSWAGALRAAGFEAEQIARAARSRPRYSSASDLVAGIRRRQRRGLRLSATDVTKGREKDWSLYERSCDAFGSWDAALQAAGLDPAAHRRRPRRSSSSKLA